MAEVIHYSATVTSTSAPQTENDRRYRVMVLLQRSDRPAYWKFHCPRCNMPVAELVNTKPIALTDSVDMNTLIGNGVRCDGRYQGKRCNVWYFFTLS